MQRTILQSNVSRCTSASDSQELPLNAAVHKILLPVFTVNQLIPIRLKKKKIHVSKLLTNWKPWPKCVFFFFSPEQQTCQIWVGHNFVQCKIWNLIFGWTRYKTSNTELKKSVVQSVLLCLSCLFILTSKFIKKKKKKIQGLNFAESNAHWKTNARDSFEICNLYFLALLSDSDSNFLSKPIVLFDWVWQVWKDYWFKPATWNLRVSDVWMESSQWT